MVCLLPCRRASAPASGRTAGKRRHPRAPTHSTSERRTVPNNAQTNRSTRSCDCGQQLVCLVLLFLFSFSSACSYLFVSCVRALGRLLEPRFVPWTELMTFDPALGWKPRPNLDAHYLAGARRRVPRSDRPRRMARELVPWRKARIAVIGDSFAFGYGVDAGRSYAELNKVRCESRVSERQGTAWCMACCSWSDWRIGSAGKLVVWFICLENDLDDNLAPATWHYRSPFAKRTANGWEIETHHVTSNPWQCSEWGRTRLLPHLCVPGPIPERVYGAADYLVGRAAAACHKVGAHLVLLTIPDPTQLTAAGRAALAARSGQPELFDEDVPDRRLAESCQRYGVTFDRRQGSSVKPRIQAHRGSSLERAWASADSRRCSHIFTNRSNLAPWRTRPRPVPPSPCEGRDSRFVRACRWLAIVQRQARLRPGVSLSQPWIR